MINIIKDYNGITTKMLDHLYLLELVINDINTPITHGDIQTWLDEAFIILNGGEINEKNITD